jgi:hypothetical protein
MKDLDSGIPNAGNMTFHCDLCTSPCEILRDIHRRNQQILTVSSLPSRLTVSEELTPMSSLNHTKPLRKSPPLSSANESQIPSLFIYSLPVPLPKVLLLAGRQI